MKKLTALALSAAMVPALALGTAAFAQQGSGGIQADEQGIDDQGMERAGEYDEELRAGDDWDDEQRAGEQFMSRKPAGALYADDVIGTTVKLRQSDDEVGTIDDLVIGDDGRILGAVVTTGGFLGLGGRNVSLDWDHLEHSMEGDDAVFYTDIDEDTLRSAPEHQRD